MQLVTSFTWREHVNIMLKVSYGSYISLEIFHPDAVSLPKCKVNSMIQDNTAQNFPRYFPFYILSLVYRTMWNSLYKTGRSLLWVNSVQMNFSAQFLSTDHQVPHHSHSKQILLLLMAAPQKIFFLLTNHSAFSLPRPC